MCKPVNMYGYAAVKCPWDASVAACLQCPESRFVVCLVLTCVPSASKYRGAKAEGVFAGTHTDMSSHEA